MLSSPPFRHPQPGFHFFSSGDAWELAFLGAVEFLDRNESGIVLLGPGLRDSGREWLEERSLSEKPLRFGARVQEWSEWVKARARGFALGEGRGFRVLSEPARREYFRKILRTLSEHGVFHHLGDLWKEERFFAGLLGCVEEARTAGLHDEGARDRAQELLANGADAVTREAYEDFWNLLLAYETALAAKGGAYDQAGLTRLAAESGEPAPALYFLGFDRLSLLETDLLKGLAAGAAIFLPLALPGELLARVAAGKAEEAEEMPAALARALLTGFTGESFFHGEAQPAAAPHRRYFLSGHAPSEEARSAAALAAQAIREGGEARFVTAREFLEDESVVQALREELGLPEGFQARSPLARPIGRLFFHVFELKREQYELTHALELAELTKFTLGKFGRVPALAARAGVRKGLYEWKTKAGGHPELEAFACLLDELDRLLPDQGLPVVFAEAVARVAELCGIAELARRAGSGSIERDAHAILATMVRNAQLLASGAQEELSFGDWLQEWKALLQKGQAGSARSYFPQLQFYHYGEWLPPAGERTVTVALGFDAGVGPGGGFSFFLEESARRKLSDLLLPSQVQAELSFFDQVRRLAVQPGTIFSWSRHDGTGKEQQPHWISSALPFLARDWPEVARAVEVPAFRAPASPATKPPSLPTFSASLLELYKECPFKAFVLKVLRLEDKMQAASLDISDLARGNIVHKTLELYYGGERRGKEIRDPVERERVLDECLAEAVESQKIEYFKGGEKLLEAQVRRLRAMLLEFLASDAANYAEFPFFGQPLVEHKVRGTLGGKYAWEGKVDRVDVDEENRNFLVLDYKSGATTPSSTELAKLERFQLQLYMDAIEAEKPGFRAAGGLYVSLKTGERNQGLVRKEFNRGAKTRPGEVTYYKFAPQSRAPKGEEDFARIREETRQEAMRIAESVETGSFGLQPIDEESCQRCEARPACRIRELRAPERAPWPRRIPQEVFQELLAREIPGREVEKRRDRGFNEEQADALLREGQLVFIEASAGTGKTTVIVEKIRRFILGRLAQGDAPHRAVERFAAISFTDKSAQELAARLGASLIEERTLGPRVAAQAIRQVSTIHGFCRRLLSDFPVEAGVSPMAELMDERAAESLREDAFDEFFLHAPEEIAGALDALFALFPRAKVEGFLRKLLEQRLLLRGDLALYQAWLKGEAAAPGALVPAGEEKEALGQLLAVSESFQALYEKLKKQRELLDFNDLEALAFRVLEHEHCRKFYQERFSLLLVDEFQDTNSVQREILERLARPGWSNLFVVGDAKQSIYRFRAADVSVFQGLRREAEKRGELVTLFRNYRSRKEVVGGANLVTRSIFPAPGAEAFSFEATAAESKAEREGGGAVTLVEYGEAEQKLTADGRRAAESELLVKIVQEQLLQGRKPGAIAVLMRKLSSNDAFLQALTRAGIPFRVGSSRGFYAQQVVLDAIALLRAMYGASNEMALLALLRSPWARITDAAILDIQKRGEQGPGGPANRLPIYGERSQEGRGGPPRPEGARLPLWDLLRETDAPLLFAWRRLAPFLSCSELVARAFAEYPLDRREHLQVVKLLTILGKMEREGKTRVEAIERLSNWAGWESEDSGTDDSTMPEPGDGGAVQVMTVHASKGLEFDVTILPDLSSGLLPDRSALRVVPGVGLALKLEDQDKNEAYSLVGERNKERELAESKRLLYVALTRAKEECILLLPREAGDKKRKGESWADMLRESGIAGLARSRAEGDFALAPAPEERSAASVSLEGKMPAPLSGFRLETSITELAAYQFCPEFHRRKFVQGWDDWIKDSWPTESRAQAKLKQIRRQGRKVDRLDEERDAAARLLKALKLQRKERGISLHRVLERLKSPQLERDVARLWLAEAYEAQGANPELPAFAELVGMDIELLERFLRSEIGREIFSVEAHSVAEIEFQWRVGGAYLHGAIDRLIRRPSGEWVVVDYKSSVLEESRERYEFQVASYMAAVAAHARVSEPGEPRVQGYLVDLYESTSHQVEADPQVAACALTEEIASSRANYTLAGEKSALMAPGLAGGDHCLKCAYCLHCEIGLKVLDFK